MTKAELRQDFLAKRKALTTEEVNRDSQRIASNFVTYLEQHNSGSSPAVLHTFLPIKRHNEVDTWLIINQIWTNFPHIQISVPVTNQYTHQLINYTLFPSTALVENRLGIPEPAVGSRYETDLAQISIVLVPLLIFDKQGHRVGYGGGYYDRFLASCRPDCVTIGLSLFEPIAIIDDIASTDIPLDYFITPRQIHNYN